MTGPRHRRIDPRAAAVLVGLGMVLVAIAVVEVVLRIADPDLRPEPRTGQFPELFDHLRNVYHEPDPRFGWRLRPDYVEGEMRTTPDGFREAPGPLPDGYDVACLGNSVTFGYSAARSSDTYPAKVESVLVAGGYHGIEVLNAGIVGYSSEQGRRLYVERVRAHRPRVVTLLYGFNDHHLSGMPDAERLDLGSPQGPHTRLAVYRAIRKVVRDAMPDPEVREVVPRVPRDRFEANLRALVAAVRADGAAPILLTVPVRPVIPLVENPVPMMTPAGRRWASPLRRLLHALPEEARVPVTRLVFRNEPIPPSTLAAWEPALEEHVARVPDDALAHHLLHVLIASRGEEELAELHRREAARWDRERGVLERYNAVIRQVAREEGAGLVDLARELDQGAYFDDVVHLSPAGNRVAGRLVAAAVAEALDVR